MAMCLSAMQNKPSFFPHLDEMQQLAHTSSDMFVHINRYAIVPNIIQFSVKLLNKKLKLAKLFKAAVYVQTVSLWCNAASEQISSKQSFYAYYNSMFKLLHQNIPEMVFKNLVQTISIIINTTR